MPPKQMSGAQKKKRKRREPALIQSQAGDINKYFVRSNTTQREELVDELVIEEQHNHNENDEVNEDVNLNDMNEEVNLEESNEEFNSSGLNEDANIGERNNEDNLEDPRNWNNINKKIRDYLVEIGPKRVTGILFHKDSNKRHFDTSAYTRIMTNGQTHDRKWLVYSISLDRIFCFCCKLFKTDQMMNRIGNLNNEGYNDWRNMHRSLKNHEASRDHMNCICAWIDLEKRMKKGKTIDESMELQIKKERQHWRQVLTRIISIVKRLAKNSLPFRGDDEKLYLENNGLFFQMIEMVAEFDLVIEEHVRRCKTRESQYTYLSPQIQNELIETLANEVKKAIIAKVKHAKYFSAILDCTPDVSHQEQMSLVLRCVDDSKKTPKIEEYWVEFIKVDDTSGLGLSNELLNALTKLGLDIDDVRGQGYENGSNTSGRYQGLQKRLFEINPRAFYTPCGCHSFNLALVDMVECCSKAKSFFGAVQCIYTMFSFSTKRWKIFKDKVSGLTVKPLSHTRWESHVESVKAIKEQAVHIRDALLDLTEETKDSTTKRNAESLASSEFENFEFLLGMIIWYNLLNAINNVSKFLQSENMDIGIAINLLQGLVRFLDDYREQGFASAMDEATKLANEMGIEPKFREERIIRRKKQFDESGSDDVTQSGKESFRVGYFLFIIDQARSYLQILFEQFKQYQETFGFLLNLDLLKNESLPNLMKSCTKLEEFFTHDGHSDINSGELCSELMVVRGYLTSEKTAIDMLHSLAKLDGLFPHIYVAYKIMLTIPVTVASAERSFSNLKLIKNYLRSTMSQDRLNGLAMLSIEKEMAEQLDYTDLISIFASKTARRVVFM